MGAALFTPFATLVAVLVAYLSLNSTIEASDEQQELAEQGQITDRFTRAIDQLGQEGEEKMAVRLGGIYALERIMRDARIDEPNPVDQRNIVELLCAFIREHTKEPGPVSPETKAPEPRTDVQAALTVLARRPHSGTKSFGTDPKYGIVDLRRIRLDGAYLEGGHLEGAHLEGAQLDRANLQDAHLNGAHLGRELDGVYMNGAVLSGADLSRADLTGAHLEDSYIAHDTKMNKTNLTGARLYGVHLGSGVEKEGDVKMGADLSSTAGLKFESLRCAFVEESKNFPMKFPVGVSVPPDRSACPAVS